MVDPLQVMALALANKVASRTVGSIFGPDIAPPGTIEHDNIDAYFEIPGRADEQPIAVVSQAQLADIQKFLASPPVASVVESYLLLTVLSLEGHSGAEATQQDIADSFKSLAEIWCNGNRTDSWASLAEDLWDLTTATLTTASQRVSTQMAEEPGQRRAALDYLFCVDFARGNRAHHASKYIRSVAEIMRSTERLRKVSETVSEICRAMAKRYSEMVIVHAQEDYRFDASQLYVARTVQRTKAGVRGQTSGEEVDVDELLGPSVRRRAVILGDPGVGKSTLVRHIVFELSKANDWQVAPLLITCREYAVNFDSTGIIEYMLDRLRVELSLILDQHKIDDVLSMGRACVIFDGLDEVLDQTQRRALVRRIESFSYEYPALTIVTTARRIGYSEARFNADFEVVELSEFTDEQLGKYVELWFSAVDRLEDRGDFLNESESVIDIRLNPLMLSLLCALYQARGYIPQNRRSIYRECAELLFTRWDTMRKIEQPIEHRQYGSRLMQEIALLFFRSQFAQAGLEEGQLQGIIANFFQDTAGVERDESYARADKFLKFCSGRAWLLSAKGITKRDARLFGFTHRTFMEGYSRGKIRHLPGVLT